MLHTAYKAKYILLFLFGVSQPLVWVLVCWDEIQKFPLWFLRLSSPGKAPLEVPPLLSSLGARSLPPSRLSSCCLLRATFAIIAIRKEQKKYHYIMISHPLLQAEVAKGLLKIVHILPPAILVPINLVVPACTT